MTRETPEEELAQFRRNKKNRRIGEWLGLLRLFGWEIEKAKKEGYKCQCGLHTMTLPEPHGSNPILKVFYANLILRMIDLAKPDDETRNDE